jgi:translation initiation factor 1 (eIF-1/SUI1)
MISIKNYNAKCRKTVTFVQLIDKFSDENLTSLYFK